MGRLFIIGAGAQGRVVAEIAEACGWPEIAFLDDAPARWGEKLGCHPIVGNLDALRDHCTAGDGVITAIGNPLIRAKVVERASACPWVSLIHPHAWLAPSVSIGVGSIVHPGSLVNTNAAIGNHCILNTGCLVEHDTQIGDFACISPGAQLGGRSSLGKQSFLAASATVVVSQSSE